MRLDVPKGERSLTRLPETELGAVATCEGIWSAADALLELPTGAEPLDDGPRRSSLRVIFGLSHTDSNQHVNFLSYPRYVEQA